jgi:hypothetical protein
MKVSALNTKAIGELREQLRELDASLLSSMTPRQHRLHVLKALISVVKFLGALIPAAESTVLSQHVQDLHDLDVGHPPKRLLKTARGNPGLSVEQHKFFGVVAACVEILSAGGARRAMMKRDAACVYVSKLLNAAGGSDGDKAFDKRRVLVIYLETIRKRNAKSSPKKLSTPDAVVDELSKEFGHKMRRVTFEAVVLRFAIVKTHPAEKKLQLAKRLVSGIVANLEQFTESFPDGLKS